MPIQLVEFPPELQRFECLTRSAFETWAPDGEVAFRRLRQGASGSAVVRVDVRPAALGPVPPGEYILKLSEPLVWNDQEPEDVCHERAYKFAENFSKDHVPALVAIARVQAPPDCRDAGTTDRFPEQTGGSAVLFEIAGGSLDRFAPMDSLDLDYAEVVSRSLAYQLARHWGSTNPERSLSPGEILRDWLGYRLDPDAGKALRVFVGSHLTSKNSYTFGSRKLLDPFAFYDLCETALTTGIYAIDGLCHGDLHGGNVLLHRRDPVEEAFWVIDFALSRLAPLGFDHAYLEVSWLVTASRVMSEVDVMEFLDAINRGEDVFRLQSEPARAFGRRIHALRDGLTSWARESQPRRQDDINKQFLLARIAAGLNWANKSKLDEKARMVALAYASLAVEEFLREHHQEQYQDLWLAQGDEPVRVMSRF